MEPSAVVNHNLWSVVSTQPRSMYRAIGRRMVVVLRMGLFFTLYLLWPAIRLVFRPDFVFLVYGTRQDKNMYWPAWIEKLFRPVFPVGIIRRGDRWGVIAATLYTVKDLAPEKNRHILQKLLDDTRAEFKHTGFVALAGQLPGVCDRQGIVLESPFVTGVLGTVYGMAEASRRLAERTSVPYEHVTFAVIGAAGTIGQHLIRELRRDFGTVIAFDKKYGRERRQEDNVLFTNDGVDLLRAQAFLVLTPKGDDVAPLLEYMQKGSWVADDTHPCMSPELLSAFAEKGVNVLKATTCDKQLTMYPRLPNFRPDDTPGCLLEAVVCMLTGRQALDSHERFARSAKRLGFEALLKPHIDT